VPANKKERRVVRPDGPSPRRNGAKSRYRGDDGRPETPQPTH
jgi:hypothetical protein